MYRWFASAVLVVHCALIVLGARTNAVTVDEAAHIAAGVHHWRTGELGLYRVNPPLVRMIAALPALATGVVSPDRAVVDVPAFRPEAHHATALAEANRDRYHDIVFAARLPGVLWSLIGALVVWCWATDLFGRRAGLASLTLWCFEPNLIAHAQLVTPDVPAAVAGLAATPLPRVRWHRSAARDRSG